MKEKLLLAGSGGFGRVVLEHAAKEYECAFLAFLEAEGWQYLAGTSISRASRREVLYADDLEQLAAASSS